MDHALMKLIIRIVVVLLTATAIVLLIQWIIGACGPVVAVVLGGVVFIGYSIWLANYTTDHEPR